MQRRSAIESLLEGFEQELRLTMEEGETPLRDGDARDFLFESIASIGQEHGTAPDDYIEGLVARLQNAKDVEEALHILGRILLRAVDDAPRRWFLEDREPLEE